MKKNDEKMIRDAVVEFETRLRNQVGDFRETDDSEELTLDRIEAIWSIARRESDAILQDVMKKLVETSGEKKIVKKNGKN